MLNVTDRGEGVNVLMLRTGEKGKCLARHGPFLSPPSGPQFFLCHPATQNAAHGWSSGPVMVVVVVRLRGLPHTHPNHIGVGSTTLFVKLRHMVGRNLRLRVRLRLRRRLRLRLRPEVEVVRGGVGGDKMVGRSVRPYMVTESCKSGHVAPRTAAGGHCSRPARAKIMMETFTGSRQRAIERSARRDRIRHCRAVGGRRLAGGPASTR